MLNVNQITSYLAKLQPDSALQKYAQMHKDDPYIMALAMSEFNRRKQTRQGAQINAPEQPKVVDQAIQSMGAPMPEDVGIGQLPAGNMNFADGGIVAFGNGGDVPRYQSGGSLHAALTSYLKGTGQLVAYVNGTPAQRAAIEAAFQSTVGLEGPPKPTPTPKPPVAAPAAGASNLSESALRRSAMLARYPAVAGLAAADIAGIPVMAALGLQLAMEKNRAAGYPVNFTAPEFATEPTPQQLEFDEQRRRGLITEMPREERLRKFGTTDVNTAMQGRAFLPAGQAAAAAANQAAAKPEPSAAEVQMAMNAGAFKPAAPAAPGPGTGAPPNRPSASGAGQPAHVPAGAQNPLIAQLLQPVQARPINFEPSQSTMPTLEGIQNLFAASRPKPEDVVDPLAAQREELTNLATLQNAQEQAALEKQIKERGLLGEKQEARLKAREEKLGKQEKDLGPLAMIQAGFAIMGGQSRSALQNIGLGAQVGFKGYREGLEKLEASRERIEDGLERIETARRSEGILNDQQRSALRREGNNIVREGKKEGINALTAELGVKRGEANALVTAGINVLIKKGEIGSAEKTAAAQLQASADRAAQQQEGENRRAVLQAQTSTQNALTQAAATAAAAKDSRMAALAEQVRKNVVAESLKKYPYDVSAQNAYAIDEIRKAVQANPGLAQYMGVSGGGGAPAAGAATHRLNPATGNIEPVR